MGRSPRRDPSLGRGVVRPFVRVGIGNGRTRKVAGPGLTQVRMSQAVEVILIQVGVFILWAWGLPGRAVCSREGGHKVCLFVSVSLSRLLKLCLCLLC